MESPIRVLVISHGHPAFSLGGGEVASYNLHKGLRRLRGTRSFYLARACPPVPRRKASPLMAVGSQEDEILFHANDYDHFLMSNRNTGEIERDLVRFARRYAPDVIHFHHVIGLGLESIHALRRALPDAAIVFTFHEFLAICPNDGQMIKRPTNVLCRRASPIDCRQCFPEIGPERLLMRERLARAHLGLADHFVSPSAFLAERYAEWGLPRDRISVIENGLDVAEKAEPRHLLGPGERRARFAFFGQVIPTKGVDILLEAIGRVPAPVWRDDARLTIYGGNLDRAPAAYAARISDLIERAGDRVRFHGAYRNDDMPKLMRSIDWVVLPSIWWENSPVVIQEAFFHGRPVIVGDIGGMAEKVRDGIDGLHFRVGSAEDLADRFVQTLTDGRLWARLRDGIRPPTGHLACARGHLQLYRRLLRGSPDEAADAALTASPTGRALSA